MISISNSMTDRTHNSGVSLWSAPLCSQCLFCFASKSEQIQLYSKCLYQWLIIVILFKKNF